MAAQPVNVLITGANRGLGLEMVKQMVVAHRPVKKLFASCRDPDGPRAEDLRTLAKQHPNVDVIRLDANDPQSIKDGARQVGSQVGSEGLNLLVNNAGYLSKGTIQESTIEDMQDNFRTNLLGPMLMIKEFLPHLRTAVKASKIAGMSSRKAAVINMSSQMGSNDLCKFSYSFFPAAPYRMAKAGLNMLTTCAVEETKNEEILFSLLHPGWVRTEMGGPDGEIDVTESVEGMLRVIASLTEKHNGVLLDYKGLNMLTLCAAEELKKDEILFSLLHPGWERTDMRREGETAVPGSEERMLWVSASLTEKHNGVFLDYKGKSLPFG